MCKHLIVNSIGNSKKILTSNSLWNKQKHYGIVSTLVLCGFLYGILGRRYFSDFAPWSNVNSINRPLTNYVNQKERYEEDA